MNPEWPQIAPSLIANRTSNPIRKIVDVQRIVPNPAKKLLSLGLGDPTIFGNMDTHEVVSKAVVRQIELKSCNGYPPASGDPKAKAAIAARYSTPQSPLTANDVIVASGCSGAIDLAIGVLVNEGETILLPRPGFTLYGTLCRSKAIKIHYYNLLPASNWEIDLEGIKAELDKGLRPSAWLINNPSNPCGSVYSKEHLEACLALAEAYKIPVIADEIYEDMVFEGHTYWPMGTLSKTVPVLTCSGLSKRYLIPGWRLGWILLHDRNDALSKVRQGLVNLCGLILGANSVVQAALPEIFESTPTSFYNQVNFQLESNAKIAEMALSSIPGITFVKPQGTLYAMVEIDVVQFKDIRDDVHFTELLTEEEAVICLPGVVFGMPNFFRIVYCAPEEMVKEACDRIRAFCLSRQLHP